MRYLCLVGFSYAAATLACAYWLSPHCLLPLAIGALILGLLLFVWQSRLHSRILLRAILCCLSTALALGSYAHYWRSTVLPARALDGCTVSGQLELLEQPQRSSYYDCALAELRLGGQRYRVQYRAQEIQDLLPGDRLNGCFTLSIPYDESPEEGQEPGYLRSCGVQLQAAPSAEPQVSRPERLALRHWPAMLRAQLTAVCCQFFRADTSPWFLALLTNQNQALSYADRNDLKLAGLYHCMCTSGMHINVLLGLVCVLCLRHRRLAACIGLPVCVLFWAVAGGTPSVSRAVVMQALLLLAPLLQQEHDTPTALALALLLSLIVQPDSIAHLGLQLSYLSVGGIALLASPIQKWILTQRPLVRLSKHRLLHLTAQSCVSSLATALGALALTSPLLIYHYEVLPLFAPLAGLLVLPLVTLCFALGLPLTLLLALVPALSCLAVPLDWLMRLIILLTRFFAELPPLYVNSPYWVAWILLAYLLLFLLWRGKTRPPTALLALTLSFCLTFGLQRGEQWLHRNSFRLTALDVGQGQCLIAELHGQVCVFDCGSSNAEAAGELCARWLLSHGYQRIDLLALTHFHSDHAGGAVQLLSRMEVDQLLLPDVPDESGLRSAIECAANDAEIRWITEDSRLQLETGGVLTAYAPRSGRDDNEACLAFWLSDSDTDLLITGDMDRLTEIQLVKTAALPDLDVLVAGHHGSRTSNSETLLEYTQPEIILVSCSDRYGHPHSEALERFSAIGAAVLRTDQSGTITITR